MEISATAQVFLDNYVPISNCFNAQINTAYSWTPQPNQFLCVYFEISDSSRTQFFALDQTTTANVNVIVNHDVNGDQVNSFVAQNTNLGPLVFTEPGHYYAYYIMEGSVANSDPIRVGAAVNTTADDFEDVGSTPNYTGNDNIPYSVPNGIFKYHNANLDTPSDIDNYRLQSYWGQTLALAVVPTDPLRVAEIKAEVNMGLGWKPLPLNSLKGYTGLPTFGEVHVRVSASNPNTPAPANSYRMLAGSLPVSLKNNGPKYDLEASSNPLEGAGASPYQWANSWHWEPEVKDSTGNAVREATVQLSYSNRMTGGVKSRQILTDYFGKKIDQFSLPGCTNPAGPILTYDSEGYDYNSYWEDGNTAIILPDLWAFDSSEETGLVVRSSYTHICWQSPINP